MQLVTKENLNSGEEDSCFNPAEKNPKVGCRKLAELVVLNEKGNARD